MLIGATVEDGAAGLGLGDALALVILSVVVTGTLGGSGEVSADGTAAVAGEEEGAVDDDDDDEVGWCC